MKFSIVLGKIRLNVESNTSLRVEKVASDLGFVNLETIKVIEDENDQFWHICRQYQYKSMPWHSFSGVKHKRFDLPYKVLVHANCDAVVEDGICIMCHRETSISVFDYGGDPFSANT